jgi:cytochrome c6
LERYVIDVAYAFGRSRLSHQYISHDSFFPTHLICCLKLEQAVTIGALSLGIATPDSAVAGNVDQGQKVFNANCAVCHPGGRNLIVPEKSLEKEALEQYKSGGRSEESVMRQVRNGRSSMPAFGGRLDDESIADVAAYVIKSSEEGWN